MTTNQSDIIVKSPHTKKAAAALKRYAKLEAKLALAAEEAEAATETLKQAMIDAGVDRIAFDPELTGISGYITLATRTNYKVADISLLDDEYKKLTADNTKIKAQHTLTGELPEGVTISQTQYITKKIKVVDQE